MMYYSICTLLLITVGKLVFLIAILFSYTHINARIPVSMLSLNLNAFSIVVITYSICDLSDFALTVYLLSVYVSN